ncbi:MAG: 4-(cytidine 5'-diphospho)-2-C-methyl-D-erythritol kinase [Treponema sp.]|nr:4-(cytidine 5'-diphospho)-2-C-methyl-D-erythritol kinase [Treponema sp.]
MLPDIRELAQAKINIGLRVFPVREDGYHDIESIFQTVNVADEVVVSIQEGKGNCTVFCDAVALPKKNTITAAYEAFCAETGFDLSVRVNVIKRIPLGGGLGGGSSDAAACIRALCKQADTELSMEQLDRLASKIGSDVFFFLHCAHPGCAIVTGRGEKIRTIEPRNDLYVLLLFPGVQSSTKEAYGLVDEYLKAGEVVTYPMLADLESMYRSPVDNWKFCNTFTPSIGLRYPQINEALQAVKSVGASFADMTGSGSTVFGIFNSEKSVEDACVVLAKSWNCLRVL